MTKSCLPSGEFEVLAGPLEAVVRFFHSARAGRRIVRVTCGLAGIKWSLIEGITGMFVKEKFWY